jgi:hypothetical protein
METFSSIQITFNDRFLLGQSITFSSSLDGGPSLIYVEEWVNLRQGMNQVTTNDEIVIVDATPEEQALANAINSATNFFNAMVLDYGSTGLVQITRVLNIVTIRALNPTIEFDNEHTDGDATFVISNYTGIVPVLTYEISEADTNKCQNVKVTINSNVLINNISFPFAVTGNTDNPIVFDHPRGSNFMFVGSVTGFGNVSLSIVPAAVLNSVGEVTVVNSFNGGIITANVINSFLLTEGIEYSLDAEVWQESNVFPGLEEGTYTVYIRDAYGCQKIVKQNLIVGSATNLLPTNPFFYISKANAIRFANRITFGDSENYKNDENTLSCEVDVEVPYKEVQLFQSADIVTTQFKSNYSNIIASVLKENGDVVNYPIIQKTNNIGLKDKRDAKIYSLGDGKTGMYFDSGNIYNFDTNAVEGTYILNGLLPDWAVIGNFFSLDNAFYLIEDIVFDDHINAQVVVYTNFHVGGQVSVIVGSNYNRFNYEVYEFAIDMVDYIDQRIRVQLQNNDDVFPNLTHLSEEIFVKVKHQNVLEIRYKNSTNTDVMYATGIEHKIRISYNRFGGKPEESSELHKTDTDAILLNAELYEGDEIEFEPVTKEIWKKIMIALSHEIVFINGVGYVKSGEFNTEGPLERSNLYVLKATMIKTGNVYNSQTSGNLDFAGGQTEVPGLIETENGFVSY